MFVKDGAMINHATRKSRWILKKWERDQLKKLVSKISIVFESLREVKPKGCEEVQLFFYS